MVGPILSQTLPDIFCDNEYSPNFLFRNNGDGTFTDVAAQAGEQKLSLFFFLVILSFTANMKLNNCFCCCRGR